MGVVRPELHPGVDLVHTAANRSRNGETRRRRVDWVARSSLLPPLHSRRVAPGLSHIGEESLMTRVLSTAGQADVVAERDRVAWNLPSPSASATAHAPPTPAARTHLAARSSPRRRRGPRLGRLPVPVLPGTATARFRGIDCLWRLQVVRRRRRAASWGARAAGRVRDGLAGVDGNRLLGRRGRGGSVGEASSPTVASSGAQQGVRSDSLS